MQSHLNTEDRDQLAELLQRGGSPDVVMTMERNLTLLFGRRPTLWELVCEIMDSKKGRGLTESTDEEDADVEELLEGAGAFA